MSKEVAGTILHKILQRSFDIENLEQEARKSVLKGNERLINITSRNLDCPKIKSSTAFEVCDAMQVFWRAILRDCLCRKEPLSSYQFFFTYSQGLLRLEASTLEKDSSSDVKAAYYNLVEGLNYGANLVFTPSVSQFDVFLTLRLDISNH